MLMRLFLLLTTIIIFLSPLNGLTAQQMIKIGSGSEAGVYYPFAVGIADLINSKLQIMAKALSTGGSAANNEKLLNNEIQLAMMQNDVAFYAYENLENITSNPELRAIASLYSEDVHIVVRNDSGIQKLEDMKQKKINIGSFDSGQYRNAKQILEEAGIFNQVKRDHSKFDKAVDKLINGEIDGLFYTVGWPAKGLTRLANSTACRFISLEDSIIDKFIYDYPFYVKSFIPSGAYNGLDKPLQTIAVRATLVTQAQLPDSLVYAISKLVFENTDYLQKEHHQKWAQVELMHSHKGIGIPFHPGAKAYFDENVVPVTQRPYYKAPVIGYVRQGAKVKIYKNKWNRYKVMTKNFQQGWIKRKFVRRESVTRQSNIKGGEVTAYRLNFRRKPSLKASVLDLLKHGEQLERMKNENNEYEFYDNPDDDITWFKLFRSNGDIGWASSHPKYLKKIDLEVFYGKFVVPSVPSEIKEIKKRARIDYFK